MGGAARGSGDLGHGPRLSLEEYDRRIVALHGGLPPAPDKAQEESIRRRELDLAIDHRLGQDFPQARRDALWEIQQRVEKRRIRLVFYWLFHFISYRWLYTRANKLAGYLVDEYAKVLSEEKLQAFFEICEGEKPTLPMDGLK